MFDVSKQNEEFREIKVLMNGFYEKNEQRIEEGKKIKEALKLAVAKTEFKLSIDDIEGYTTSKNEEEFYRRKIKAIEEMKPIEVDTSKLRDLIKEEVNKITADFDDGRGSLEEGFMKALTDLCDFMEDKKKRIRALESLVNSFHTKEEIGVSSKLLRYMKEENLEFSYYGDHLIEISKTGIHTGSTMYLNRNK